MTKTYLVLTLSFIAASFAATPAHAEIVRTLECSRFGMNSFSGTIEVTVDQNSKLTSSVALTLSSVTRIAAPDEPANPLPQVESFLDETMTGELVVLPKGQLMVGETTVITLNRGPGSDKVSLRAILELPLKNAKLNRNGVVFEALCTEKSVQR